KSGSNGSCGGTYLCTAGVGYDGPTGIGSPNGALLSGGTVVPDAGQAPDASPPPVDAGHGPDASPPPVDAGHPADAGHVADAGAQDSGGPVDPPDAAIDPSDSGFTA